VKPTSECQHPLLERDERVLTIDDARNPLLPWLSAGEQPDDFEDVTYAATWVQTHAPTESIGSLQARSTMPERPRPRPYKKA